jgi:putative ABC transport system permease protein
LWQSPSISGLFERHGGEGELQMGTSTLVEYEPSIRSTRRARTAAVKQVPRQSGAMSWLALRMLTGDRAKYLALIFAISFSSFLITQQASIFAGVMNRTRSQINDVTDADIWVMDPATEYIDEVYSLKDTSVERVRSVPGVLWAEPLFKGRANAKAADGRFRSVVLLGVDDASLAGAPEPRKMLIGSVDNLRQPDAVLIDLLGYHYFFPGQPLELGKTFELNDHRARVAGVVDSFPPFQTSPIFYTRYSQSLNYVGQERKLLSFVLVKKAPGVSADEVTRRINAATGLKAVTGSGFGWMTIWYYIKHTAIPINFGLTIAIALIVGTVVAGQTFYLFTLENLKQFGALKAMGTSNRRLLGMILLQAVVVGAIGYGIGMGLTAVFFAVTRSDATRGFFMFWQAMVGTGAVVVFIVAIASVMSIRKVLVLEPAMVFRG